MLGELRGRQPRFEEFFSPDDGRVEPGIVNRIEQFARNIDPFQAREDLLRKIDVLIHQGEIVVGAQPLDLQHARPLGKPQDVEYPGRRPARAGEEHFRNRDNVLAGLVHVEPEEVEEAASEIRAGHESPPALAPHDEALAGQFRERLLHRADGDAMRCREFIFRRDHLIGFPYSGGDGRLEDFLELVVERDKGIVVEPRQGGRGLPAARGPGVAGRKFRHRVQYSCSCIYKYRQKGSLSRIFLSLRRPGSSKWRKSCVECARGPAAW